jgi:DNA-binding winged helix-turn-helix (wHTH) protein
VDQIVHKVVQFDRFALDLTRGCLRNGEQGIDLRPKTFQVLTYLALNAGRLVPKKELLDAVWAGVVVSDESLVQCVRELRQKMGDDAHRLIKTVPRRGYVLEATITTQAVVPASQSFSGEQTAGFPQRMQGLVARFGAPHELLSGDRAGKQLIGLAASGLACLLLAAVYFLVSLWTHHPPPRPSELFTEADAMRVATIAADKQLPLPAIRILEPAPDVPKGIRRFVGVWVSDKGWPTSNRQLMLIVTHVDREGFAVGYAVDGPPQPMSHIQSPAGFNSFRARISGASLSYGGEHDQRVISFTPENRILFHKEWPDGFAGSVSLDPVWILVEAERAASTHDMAR